MRTLGMVAGLVVVFAIQAMAQDKKAPAGESAGNKPAPELAKLDNMIGTWKCVLKMHSPAGQGGDTELKATVVIKKALDGHWLTGTYVTAKSKNSPAMQENFTWGYNPVEKKYVELAVNSMGGMLQGTADGWEGSRMVWNEEGVMMGKAAKVRTTLTTKSDKDFGLANELETEPGKFVPMADTVCKK